MRIPFTPVVYEHAARFVGRTPWEVSRDAELLFEGHRRAYLEYHQQVIAVGIDIYNVEAEAYGARVEPCQDSAIPAIHQPLWTSLDEGIAVPGTNESPTLWAAGDGSGGSTKDGFLGYDMCWTAYWMLKWRASGLPGNEGVLPRCRKLAQFITARQMANGMLPTRFAEDGSVQEERSKTVKAETGPVVLFLLELYDQDRNPLYLEAARKGFAFLEKEVIPLRQWYDYETFWSCSPRKAQFDERTQQWPANNLALAQTVAAYLLAHRITGEASYLAQGEALLDYLLLYRQCWTNPPARKPIRQGHAVGRLHDAKLRCGMV